MLVYKLYAEKRNVAGAAGLRLGRTTERERKGISGLFNYCKLLLKDKHSAAERKSAGGWL